MLYGRCDITPCISSCIICLACCIGAVTSILTNICFMYLFCILPIDGTSGPSMRFFSLNFSLLANMSAA